MTARSKARVCGSLLAGTVVSNPAGGMDVCLLSVLSVSGRGLFVALIAGPEESYRLWCVVVCDLETSRTRPWARVGWQCHRKENSTSQAMYVQHRDTFVLPLLLWKSSITYCKCVFVALAIQHAMRLRYSVICGLPRSTKFSTLSHIRHDFRKEILEYKICVMILSTSFV